MGFMSRLQNFLGLEGCQAPRTLGSAPFSRAGLSPNYKWVTCGFNFKSLQFMACHRSSTVLGAAAIERSSGHKTTGRSHLRPEAANSDRPKALIVPPPHRPPTGPFHHRPCPSRRRRLRLRGRTTHSPSSHPAPGP